MYEKKKKIILIWGSISFALALIGVILIQVLSLYNFQYFRPLLVQLGNALTIIGLLSTFFALLTSVLFLKPQKAMEAADNTTPLDLSAVIIFAAIFTYFIQFIINISTGIYIFQQYAAIMMPYDQYKYMALNVLRGMLMDVGLYSTPVFAIIELILFVNANKKHNHIIITVDDIKDKLDSEEE